MRLPVATRRCAYLLVLVLAVAFLLAPIRPAQASPADLCTEPLNATTLLKARIDAHNAQPHQFELPKQQAAFAAYNAEAHRLNLEKTRILARLENCVAAMKALEDTAAGSPPLTPPQARTVRKIQAALDQVPANWQRGPRPSPQEYWRVPDGLRPLYDTLRGVSPPGSFRTRNVPLRGQPRPAAGSPDPAYPGKTIGQRANTYSDVSPDHIVPLAEIVQMPSFLKLRPENMYQVANARMNLQWMSSPANDAKSSRSVAGMSGVDPVWQQNQIQLEIQVRRELRKAIDTLLKSQK
ncbi:hypothetical protein O7602_16010 [Micromonospora sp. WMMD1128]|uniref:hypothetical protein n=1 Tax=Micromonospora sp. WMMD1128 TaxID=3015150 RepID=UPI00248AA922|nr:hypothetical protein [Micromonospora sp. WMMD1128]WBB71266.1 hypothetical protein O7602_16010 [Micromonospora sp. WMMD1128]